ncbi:unnamed protein product [Schistosoma intercalatum]|nr:unnamed protein product [Schistosoma intercalatum]
MDNTNILIIVLSVSKKSILFTQYKVLLYEYNIIYEYNCSLDYICISENTFDLNLADALHLRRKPYFKIAFLKDVQPFV